MVWLPFFAFSHILGISSSQLINIFQRGGPTTNQCWFDLFYGWKTSMCWWFGVCFPLRDPLRLGNRKQGGFVKQIKKHVANITTTQEWITGGGRPPCQYSRHHLNICLNSYLYKTGEFAKRWGESLQFYIEGIVQPSWGYHFVLITRGSDDPWNHRSW